MTHSEPVSIRTILGLHPRRTASVTALLALAGAAEGFGLLTLLPVLDSVAGNGSPTPVSERIERGLRLVGVAPTVPALVIVIGAALFLKAGFRWVAMAQVGTAVATVAAELRMRLIRALLGARYEHFAELPTGRAASAMSRDAYWAAFAYRDACAALAAALQLLVYAAAVLLLSWRLGAMAVAVGLAVSAPLGVWVRIGRRAGARQTRHAESLVTRLVDLLNVIKPVKAMAREQAFLEGLAGEAEALRRAEADHVRASEGLRSLQEPLLAVVVLGLLVVALTRGGIALPTVLVLAVLFQRMVGRFHVAQTEYQAMAAAASAYASLERQIAEAVRSAPAVHESGSGGRTVISPTAPDLEVRGVRFHHRGRPVLEGVSLVVPAGSFVAVVGPSGAGKSTLLDLLAGLREPEAGEVRVNGVPLRDLEPGSWHRHLGYVPQESVLLHDSVLRNVLLGAEGSDASDAAHAMHRAGAGSLLASLPDGLETVVGERGLRLSGGERRRLALARALVGRPNLLLLDEPTSELDEASAAALATTLRSLRGEITLVAVTHDETVASAADAVYLLDVGRLFRRELPVGVPPGPPSLTVMPGGSAHGPFR